MRIISEKRGIKYNGVKSEMDLFSLVWSRFWQADLWECFIPIFHILFKVSHFQASDDKVMCRRIPNYFLQSNS